MTRFATPLCLTEEWESANSLACGVHVSVIAHFEMNRLRMDEEEERSRID